MKITCRIGCTGLLTDLPLMVAQTKGYLAEADVDAALSVELGWASIEMKLASGQLSAANVPPTFPLLLSLQKGGFSLAMQALAITAYQGEAITLGHEAAAAFHAGKLNAVKSLRIGVDAPHTLAHAFVRSWLKTARAEHNPAIQLIPLAVSQLIELMKDGYIQGFCCAEPLGRIAVDSGLGLTVVRSRDLPPLQIQSVLAATGEFTSAHPGQAKALATAISRARVFCANPKHEAEIIRIYRKHLANHPAVASQTFAGSGPPPALATLIGFEPANPHGHTATKDKDPLHALAAVCTTLPGVTAGEREIREVIKKIFSSAI